MTRRRSVLLLLKEPLFPFVDIALSFSSLTCQNAWQTVDIETSIIAINDCVSSIVKNKLADAPDRYRENSNKHTTVGIGFA